MVNRDTQRECANPRDAIAVMDEARLAIHFGAADPLAAVEKMPHVHWRMKANQIAPEHPFEQLASPWKDAEDLLGRPRYVPEKPDSLVRAAFTQQGGHQRQVEILHPGDVVEIAFGLGGCRKHAIDMAVGTPVRRLEMAIRCHEVH